MSEEKSDKAKLKNDDKNIENDENDVKKILMFLLRKEVKDKSKIEKTEFLLKKYKQETIDKAYELYNNIVQLENTDKNGNESPSEFMKFFGILSVSSLTTLGLNYLIDINRNKKNNAFFGNCEEKFKEEFKKSSEDTKSEIKNQLTEFVPKNDLDKIISEQITQHNAKKDTITMKLRSAKSVSASNDEIKTEITEMNNKLKDLLLKIENNNLFVKEEVLKEMDRRINQNNNDLLIKIFENQTKIFSMIMNNPNDTKLSSLNLITTKEESTLNKENEKNENIITADCVPKSKNCEIREIYDKCLGNLSQQDKDSLKAILSHQFNNLMKSYNQNNSVLLQINLSNSTLKSFNNENLVSFLEQIGFKKKSNNILIIDNDKLNNLENFESI